MKWWAKEKSQAPEKKKGPKQRRGSISLGLALAGMVFFAPPGAAQNAGKPRDPSAGERPAGAPPPAAGPASTPAAAVSDLSDFDRLAAALKLKESRRLEEAIPLLESLARAGKVPPGALDRASNNLPIDLDEKDGRQVLVPSAVGVLAELEAIDARLRLGLMDGLTERIRRMLRDFGANPEIRRRARALNGLIPLRSGALLEPNAISRVDLGKQFKERFFAGREETSNLQVPLDLPLRHLSRLLTGLAASRLGPRAATAAVSVVGFLEIADLSADRMREWRPVFESFDLDPRVLIALFVFTGSAEPPATMAGEEPWSRAAVFWIRGTPACLASAVVRSRFEWLSGPTFFLLEPGGKTRSWRWPQESWKGFLSCDLPGVLASGGPTAAEEPPKKVPGIDGGVSPKGGADAGGPAKPAGSQPGSR